MIKARIVMEFDEDSELQAPYGRMATFIDCEPDQFEEAMARGAEALVRMRRNTIQRRALAEYKGQWT